MKMKAAAVICEFNPMHKGHEYLLSEIRKRAGEDAMILALMSGDYVQRGEPAVFGKYERAKTAVQKGADLVLELPFPWSCAVAENFASGALSILEKAGIDELYFGTEGRSAGELLEIARRMEDPFFIKAMADCRKTDKSLSYPKLVERVYSGLFGVNPPRLPNEILALEYMKQIDRRKMKVRAEAIPLLEGFGAQEERARIRESGERNAAFLENGERALIGQLLLRTDEKRGRFAKNVFGVSSLGGLFEKVRTPNDTDARLRRELLSEVFDCAGVEKTVPIFTVLLAADRRGQRFLSQIRKSGALPIVVRHARPPKMKEKCGETAKEFERQYALYLVSESFYPLFTAEMHDAESAFFQKPYIAETD